MQSAALEQGVNGRAAVNVVITAVFERTTTRYGQRGIQYVFQESGHAAQNIYLQATALGLGSVIIGAFVDSSVRKVIGVGANESPVYVQSIGVPVA
ncbi:MAG: SagB/ThcOx family dehydrogenase [Thaumarchaeota archaeon]|nr:SagB/ThcOx family dehydrogenase [Nitrososphaerota archaeon]